MPLNTSLSVLAPYVSGGMIGGSGTGVLYVSWLAKGINAQEGNTFDFRTGTTGDTDTTVAVGTTFDYSFIRAMSASASNSGIQNYNNSSIAPSVGTDLYVAKFTFGSGNTTRVDVYVNQTTEGTPTVTTTGFCQFNTISFSKYGSGPVPSIDEIRIAGTYSAVLGGGTVGTSGLATFRSTYNLPANGSQDMLMPAGDGVKTLLKYAFNMIGNGTGQKSSISTPNTSTLLISGSAGLPRTFVNASGRLVIVYIRRNSSTNPGVTYGVEFSTALSNSWAINSSATESAMPIDSIWERVTVNDNVNPPKRFVRVKVTTTE